MISHFVENLKQTEYYTNHKLQLGIIISGIAIGLAAKLLPGLRENILAIMISLIIVGGPITILAIYDGIIKD